MNNIFSLLVKLNPLKWENIKPSLNILWKGLLAIFVVIGIIIVVVKLVDLCISKAESAKKAREERIKAESSEGETTDGSNRKGAK